MRSQHEERAEVSSRGERGSFSRRERECPALHDPDLLLPFFEYTLGEYRFNSCSPDESRESLELMVAASRQKPEPVKQALGGRATLISFRGLRGEKEYVLKSYRRGGFFRHLLPRGVFFGCGEERSYREWRAMLTAQHLGVTVPTAFGTLVRGSRIRREWLAMETLPPHETLASLCGRGNMGRESSVGSEDLVELTLQEVVRQIEILIDARILHVDLHPGNVLRSQQGVTYIIDFDHAKRVVESPKQLRERYIRRWRRAVIKHELPEFLSEVFCSLLRTREPREAEEAGEEES
ncbi:phosphotransferase [bacterium]|nr:phosphotransferase [bacterium]